ncbi:Transmembrane protein [Mycena sanguinolenta]|uniref:Transmembrane protein n=1 Tax=Mycena sanguinolenta TaxID=230812 RepID=A0A8H6YQN9_9AGAR|nr:Transmembrane protein [Mycena sanguinolenta]
MGSEYLLVSLYVLFFAVAGYAIIFSAFLPLTGISFLDALAQDTHYKYFAILLIPTTAYFVIANWVGWQYYRNS